MLIPLRIEDREESSSLVGSCLHTCILCVTMHSPMQGVIDNNLYVQRGRGGGGVSIEVGRVEACNYIKACLIEDHVEEYRETPSSI